MYRIMASLALASLAVAALASQESSREFVAEGEVLAVSVDARTFTLDDVAEVRRQFTVDDETKLTASGQPIELEDVRVGSFATVRYVMDNGVNIARSVDIGRPASD